MNYDIEENNSKVYFNGSIWKTNNFGQLKIIGKNKSKYICEFEDGTKVLASHTNIKNGGVRNPNYPTIYKIGFWGEGEYKTSIEGTKKMTKEYNIWNKMLERCYSEKTQIKHPTYIGCIVDKRWHNFQNFCEDIKELEGYNEWKNSTKDREYVLDKDIKVKDNKIYSKNTCVFITSSKNSIEVNKRTKTTGLTYIAHRIDDGYIEEFFSQREFCEKYKLSRYKLRKAIFNDKNNECDEWIITIKEEL